MRSSSSHLLVLHVFGVTATDAQQLGTSCSNRFMGQQLTIH
jgi:hypothetical protein